MNMEASVNKKIPGGEHHVHTDENINNINTTEKIEKKNYGFSLIVKSIAAMFTDKKSLQSEVRDSALQSEVEDSAPIRVVRDSPLHDIFHKVDVILMETKTGDDLKKKLEAESKNSKSVFLPFMAALAWRLLREPRFARFLKLNETSTVSLGELNEMRSISSEFSSSQFISSIVEGMENQAARMIASACKRYIASRPVKARKGHVDKDRCWDLMDPIQKRGKSSPDNLPDYIVLSMDPKTGDISHALSLLLKGYTEKINFGTKTYVTKIEPQKLIDEAEKDPESVSKREAAENEVKEAFERGWIFITCKCRRQNHCVSFPYLKYTLSDTGKLRNISDISFTGPKVPTQNVVSMPDLEVKCEKDSDSKEKGCNRKYALGNVIDFFRILALRFSEFPYGGAVVREIDAFIEGVERCKIDVIKAKNGTLASSCPKQGCPCASGFLRPLEAIPSFGIGRPWRYKHPEKFVICPQIGCGEHWCTLCGPEHTDSRQPCDHRRNFQNHPERKYFEEQIAAGNLQKCPQCWHLQDRRDGCSKMICGSCDSWYCHDCGDSITKNSDYIADHLFTLSGRDTLRNNSMPCRRSVVREAMMGNQKMVRQIVESHHRMLIIDFFHILENESSLDVTKIPGHLLDWARESNASPEQKNVLETRLRSHS